MTAIPLPETGGGGLTPADVASSFSIDLNVDSFGVLTADLLLSAMGEDAGYQPVELIIEADGLRAQISNADIEGAVLPIDLTTDVTGVLPVANGGTNASSFTGSRAVQSNAGGTALEVSVTTATELAYVNGVTSAIQTQLNAKQPGDADLTAIAALTGTGYLARTAADTWALRTWADSGTIAITNPAGIAGNSSADIVADSITNAMINSVAAIAFSKLAALTASRAVQSGVGGFLEVSAVTTTELGYVSGVTSALQTQLNNKQPLDTGLTNIAALTGAGVLCATATDTYALRTLTAVADVAAFAITNPQGVAGNPTFTYTDARTPNATNASFVGTGQTASATGATATNLQTATATFSTDQIEFTIEVGVGANERASIKCVANYGSASISAISDTQGLFLVSDAGTGIYVFKSASSGVVSIKNRMGGSRVIRVYGLDTTFSATTAWA